MFDSFVGAVVHAMALVRRAWRSLARACRGHRRRKLCTASGESESGAVQWLLREGYGDSEAQGMVEALRSGGLPDSAVVPTLESMKRREGGLASLSRAVKRFVRIAVPACSLHFCFALPKPAFAHQGARRGGVTRCQGQCGGSRERAEGTSFVYGGGERR